MVVPPTVQARLPTMHVTRRIAGMLSVDSGAARNMVGPILARRVVGTGGRTASTWATRSGLAPSSGLSGVPETITVSVSGRTPTSVPTVSTSIVEEIFIAWTVNAA